MTGADGSIHPVTPFALDDNENKVLRAFEAAWPVVEGEKAVAGEMHSKSVCTRIIIILSLFLTACHQGILYSQHKCWSNDHAAIIPKNLNFVRVSCKNTLHPRSEQTIVHHAVTRKVPDENNENEHFYFNRTTKEPLHEL